jgi:hypothetical protein
MIATTKDKLLAFLVSKMGGVITPFIAMGIAAVVSKLAMIDPKLAESVDQVSLTGFVVALPLLTTLPTKSTSRESRRSKPWSIPMKMGLLVP